MRRIIFLLLAGVVIAIGICLYNGNKILKSENLKTIIAQRIADRTDMQVSIGGAHLYLLQGTRIILTDFSMEGQGESISLKARKVNVGFSLIHLIQGKLNLRYVNILEPDAVIRFDNFLKKRKDSKNNRFPHIKIVDGSFKAIYKEHEVDFHNINGHMDAQSLKMTVEIPSGEALVIAEKKEGVWEGKLSVLGFNLKTLYAKISGEISANIGFKMVDDMVYVATRVDCPRISLPMGGQDLEAVALDIRAHGTKDIVLLDRIDIHTNTASLSGSATITGKSNKIGDSVLDLNLSSNTFSYEKFVSHLPVHRFSYWFHKAFFEMMRDGDVSLTELKYNGALNDFKDKEQLLFNLYIKGDIKGMSFGAGHRPERITDINGTLVLEDNRLVLDNISGMAGKSKIEIDEFNIPNIACRGFDMFLRMDVNLPFEDFVYGWKAALTPQGVNDIFGKISEVKDGRITGSVTYRKDTLGIPHEMMCDFDLCHAAFFWKNNFLEDVDAHILAQNYGSPLEINLKGRLDNLPLEDLNVTMHDPFKERRYTFSIKALGLPHIPGFNLENNSIVVLTGSGQEKQFQGTAKLSSVGFRLFENKYKPVKGILKGQATFTGQLWPELSFAVSDGELNYPPGNNIDLELIKEGKNGTLTLKGNVNLYHSDDKRKKADQLVNGGINVAMNWHEKRDTTAVIRLMNMRYPFYSSAIVLDGSIEMKGERLSTKGLMLVQDGKNMMVSGFLNHKNSYFIGDLDVSGYKLERSGSKSKGDFEFHPPDSFTADVYLDMTDLEIWGMDYTRGKVLLSIDKNGVTFDSLDLKGNTSHITGSAFVGPKQAPRFNLDVDFRNEGLEKWINIISTDKMRLKGKMHLYGNINGTLDDLNGKLKFAANKGHIQSFSLISNMFAVLNPYKIFKDKDLDLSRKGFSYNVISSTFDIQKNFLKFDDFYMDTNSIQLSCMGNIDMKTEQIDAILGVQPLESLDKAISSIPIVGWMLTGSDDKLILISLKITGNIRNPSIRIARRDTISEPMADSFLRLLELPETLIESSKELINTPKE